MPGIGSAADGYLAAGLFGFGIGGVLTLLPVAWADYFGRANYGAIRGIALSVQVLAQATGPLLSGVLYDLDRQLHGFAALLRGAVGAQHPGRACGTTAAKLPLKFQLRPCHSAGANRTTAPSKGGRVFWNAPPA